MQQASLGGPMTAFTPMTMTIAGVVPPFSSFSNGSGTTTGNGSSSSSAGGANCRSNAGSPSTNAALAAMSTISVSGGSSSTSDNTAAAAAPAPRKSFDGGFTRSSRSNSARNSRTDLMITESLAGQKHALPTPYADKSPSVSYALLLIYIVDVGKNILSCLDTRCTFSN